MSGNGYRRRNKERKKRFVADQIYSKRADLMNCTQESYLCFDYLSALVIRRSPGYLHVYSYLLRVMWPAA